VGFIQLIDRTGTKKLHIVEILPSVPQHVFRFRLGKHLNPVPGLGTNIFVWEIKLQNLFINGNIFFPFFHLPYGTYDGSIL
jgi:hypothetical protein